MFNALSSEFSYSQSWHIIWLLWTENYELTYNRKQRIGMRLNDNQHKFVTLSPKFGTFFAVPTLRTIIKQQNNTILPNIFSLQYKTTNFTQQLTKEGCIEFKTFIKIYPNLLGTSEVIGHSKIYKTTPATASATLASDAQAIKVLNTVYRKYASYSSLMMDIDITIQDGDYSYKKTGKAFVKGDKYRLETSDEDIVSDSKSLWVYLKGDKSLQITNASNENQNFFCYPALLLQKYQKYCAVEFISNKANNYVVQFTSYNDDCPYEKITVYISKSTYNIQKIEAKVSGDIGYTVNVKSIQKNLNINNSKFSFDEKKVQRSKIRDLRTEKK